MAEEVSSSAEEREPVEARAGVASMGRVPLGTGAPALFAVLAMLWTSGCRVGHPASDADLFLFGAASDRGKDGICWRNFVWNDTPIGGFIVRLDPSRYDEFPPESEYYAAIQIPTGQHSWLEDVYINGQPAIPGPTWLAMVQGRSVDPAMFFLYAGYHPGQLRRIAIPLGDIDRILGNHYEKAGQLGREENGKPGYEMLVEFWDRVVQPQLDAMEAKEGKPK
jgi:hypothetical protein